MRMVDSMEASYSMHGHARSLSSIASTILPMASDASTYTSVTASPMEPHDLETLPIELKIPLPSSSCCSEQDFQALKEDLEVPKTDKSTGEGKSQHVSEGREDNLAKEKVAQETKYESDWPESSGSRIVSLEDLAQLVDLEAFQKRRAVSASSHLDRLSITCGLKRRLCSTMTIAYGNLIDQYKSDDQAGFTGLYESMEKLKRTCARQMRGAGIRDIPRYKDFTGEPSDSEDHQPWTSRLAAGDQKSVLEFLMRIRNNPDYLATRIALLSPSELAALTSSYHPAGVDLSVLANHSHGMTQFYSQDSQMMKLSRRMDNLQHFHDQDPFFTLVYCLFDTAARPGSLEYARRNDAWSSICAKVIIERRPGGDELIIAAADAFMSFEEWVLKPRIELYLQNVLSEGSFLLDPLANEPLDPNEPMESKNANYAIKAADFFDKALRDLFDLIASVPHEEALPRTARDFVQSTANKIQDPQLQLKAKHFLISRWYFASFLSGVLVYPELQGLLMTHHIGESARQSILKQIVIRMQAQVFDVLLSQADDMLVTLESRVQILAISNYFEPASPELSPSRSRGEKPSDCIQETQAYQFMLSHQDLLGLIHTLYPKNPLPEQSMESANAAISSAPPSTTSSSTLRPESSEAGSSASSMGPNYSGSSVNSEATITGNAALHPQPVLDNSSYRLSNNTGPSIGEDSDVDPTELASRLWTVHAKLQAMTRNGTDTIFESSKLSRWASFPVQSNGRVAINPPIPTSGLYAIDESTHWSRKAASDYQILKQAILTLMTTRSQRPSSSLECDQSCGTVQDSLRLSLEKALADSRLSMDFLTAQHWHKCLEIYSGFTNVSVGRNSVQDLLGDLGRQLQRSIENNKKSAQANERMMRLLSFVGEQQDVSFHILENQRKALRIKMWYISDVRHSSTYEEALLVSKALRAMSTAKRTKQAGSTFSWARQRLRGAQSQERAEAQTLEAMTAPKGCGGRLKLADDQVEMTSRWLTRSGIENFCKGEERVHRFCYEIQKSVGKLSGASLLDSPVLWSSHLFRREKATLDTRNPRTSLHTQLSSFSYGASRVSSASGPRGLTPNTSPVSVGAHTEGLEYSLGIPLGSQAAFAPPSLSTASRPTISFPPNASANNKTTRPSPQREWDDDFEQFSFEAISVAKETFIKNIKDALYGLLTSDLGYLLWSQGSETDVWINKAALEERTGQNSALNTVRSSLEVQTGEAHHNTVENSTGLGPESHSSQNRPDVDAHVTEPSFAFSDAYRSLLHRMSTTYDPSIKLEMLWQLENLVIRSLQDCSRSESGAEASIQIDSNEPQVEPMMRSQSPPRSKATSLEEVIANCTERRAGVLRANSDLKTIASTDAIVNQLLTIFGDHELRPGNLFLSLQYIAAFIPPHTLDHTAHGKAFWDCSLAALALKEDLCNCVLRRAAEITNAHITTRHTSPPYSSHQEAVNLWLVAAKEGSPIAARELGLFYLTHPDLLPQRITMPLSRTRDVFKSAKASDGGVGDDKERGALDPLTFNVVYHWMEIAANGGDAEAKAFLSQGGSG